MTAFTLAGEIRKQMLVVDPKHTVARTTLPAEAPPRHTFQDFVQSRCFPQMPPGVCIHPSIRGVPPGFESHKRGICVTQQPSMLQVFQKKESVACLLLSSSPSPKKPRVTERIMGLAGRLCGNTLASAVNSKLLICSTKPRVCAGLCAQTRY